MSINKIYKFLIIILLTIPFLQTNAKVVANNFLHNTNKLSLIEGQKTIISPEEYSKYQITNLKNSNHPDLKNDSKKPKDNDSIKLSAKAAIVIDAKTGEVIFSKNIDESLPIASLTKLMTALVFLENNPGWNKVVTYQKSDDDVLKYAKKYEMAYLKVNIGDQMKVEDLFYTGLVGSANNSVYALVRSTGLSRDEFVNLMNKKAKELGLKNTNFVEPSGLSPENVSSAKDLSKIAYHALQDNNIRLATSYRWWEFKTINTKKYHKVKSINNLLKKKLKFTIRGSKTGYLQESKRCLVAKGKKKDKEVLALVLGGDQGYFNEVEKLINFGLGI